MAARKDDSRRPFPALLAADWSKHPGKRALWEADAAAGRVAPVPGGAWDLERVLAAARERRGAGGVVLAMDLVLGVARGYLADARRRRPWGAARTFLDLLVPLSRDAPFWDEVRSAAEWTPERPFFSVPPGKGSMTAFARPAGYDLVRDVDRRCGSNPPFCVSGIPGTVGSGTRALWRELAPRLRNPRDFAVWPFEGGLDSLLAGGAIAVAELYPALAYAVALGPALPAARLRIAKTRRPDREAALERLAGAAWLREHGVDVEESGRALDSEDDFDAMMSAAALLRCTLEATALEEPARDDPVAEGGILLTGAVDLDAPSRRLRADPAR